MLINEFAQQKEENDEKLSEFKNYFKTKQDELKNKQDKITDL